MLILVANRGEIARRVIRTARRLGHRTLIGWADPDRDAPATRDADIARRLGPADLAASYLDVERLVALAVEEGADAVHPGYGFLSENADFARAVRDAGLVWIGPHPDAIAAMGSKIEARRLAAEAGVPVIPGFDGSQAPDDLAAAAGRIGYPVLVKASAGGGGKGIRIARSPDEIADAIAQARSEAERSFGDGSLIVERYITRPRHVEVQIMGDTTGAVVDLGTRECSVQRRYQKLLEEAPAPNLPDATRSGLRSAARSLAKAIGYDNAGTVEFVVDDDTGDHFFLEMNTRLQVEHPVTEMVTGLDLVELQIRAASGEALDLGVIEPSGHAFEARINAEDPARGFAPQTGTIIDLVVPDGVRWESGVEAGSVVGARYDPMVAKLIAGGRDRATALRRLESALDHLLIGGLVTNTGFHRWLVATPQVVEGRVTTRFLDETDIPAEDHEDLAAALAGALWAHRGDPTHGSTPWSGPFRLTPHRPRRRVFLHGTRMHDIEPGVPDRSVPHAIGDRTVSVAVAGRTHTFRVLTRSERWAPDSERGHGTAGAVVAPFPGVVTAVHVAPGDHVAAGGAVAEIEAMKMLHPLTSPAPGVVAEVRVEPGDQVATDQTLVTFRGDPT